jgi:predicted TIM-barrel fold metal-dependent hydrolase
MARAGVCGIRLNFVNAGVSDAALLRERFLAAVRRVAKRNWHIQIYTNLAGVGALAKQVTNAPVAVVFDHFADAKASLGVGQAGFSVLLELVRSGKAYVKLSAAYRISQKSPDYLDVAPLARALVGTNPDRVLWGTDWPHPDTSQVPGRKSTDLSPFLQIDDGLLLNQLPIWAPTAELRRKILVENPARLYGF